MCAEHRPSSFDAFGHDYGASSLAFNGKGGSTLSPNAPAALQKYKDAIENASRITGIDANLIAAMIWAESRGNPDEWSHNSDGNADVGLMQISQSTFDGLNTKMRLNVNDPEQNILAGAMEFSKYLNQFHGDVVSALKRYVWVDASRYVTNVLGFYNDLKSGKRLSDQDYA